MPCLVMSVILFCPRLVLFLCYWFTNWTKTAFDGHILPFLGWLFCPYATIFYMCSINYSGHFGFWVIFWSMIGLIVDCVMYVSV